MYFLSTFFVLFYGCRTIPYDGNWIEDPIKIDGDFSDWEKIPAQFFEEQNVLMAACNDADNLYLAFRFREPKWAMAIQMTGLTIWLDTKGKKNADFGIRYTGGPGREKFDGQKRDRQNMPAGNMLDDKMRQMERKMPDSSRQFMVLNSEWWYKEQAIPIDGSRGPSVRYRFENDMYTYEFSIPLASSVEPLFGIGTSPGNILGIGLNWGKMEMGRPDKGMDRGGIRGGISGGGEDGGFPGGMGGGFPGGDMGGGGGRPSGGMRPNNSDMPEEQKIWIKTSLAAANQS